MVDDAQVMNANGQESDPPRKTNSFWRATRGLLITLVVLLLVGLFLLPSLTARYIQHDAAQAWIAENLSGSVEIGDVSVGWKSPIMLNDVRYKDNAGKQLFDVRAITSNQSLMDVFGSATKPIELEFEGLHAVFVVPRLRPTTAPQRRFDLESVLKAVLAQHIPRMDRPVVVTVIDSQVDLHDPAGNLLVRWSPIQAQYSAKVGERIEQHLSIEAPVKGQQHEQRIAYLDLEAQWTSKPQSKEAESLTINVNSQQHPLDALEPLLEAWLADQFPLEPATGSMTGHLERIGQHELSLRLDSQFVNVADRDQSAPLDFDIDARYSKQQDRIEIRRLYAQIDQTAVDAQGAIDQVSGQQLVDATGQLQTPAGGLKSLLPEELREHVKFEDLQMSEVSIRGPLRDNPDKPFELRFELTSVVTWKRATAFGLQSQAGKVKLLLSGSDLSLTPVNLPVSGGQLRQLPRFDLSTDPVTLSVQTGPVLEHVQLTPDVCRDWLRYVSPILSDATSPSGTFSLSVNEATFQLAHLEKAEVSGRMRVHQARVRPGPLAKDVIALVGAIPALNDANQEDLVFLTMNEHDVAYHLHDGRVHHSGLTFQIGKLSFESRGSVGLDDSLDIVISMAFPDGLVNRGPILQSLKNETLDFRVTGSLDEPRIDPEPFKQFGTRVGVKAAAGLLEKILQNRAEKRRKKDK